MTDDTAPKRFDINAAVVFRLGEELITDAVQALVELVKNSYDADASWVTVKIDTEGKNEQAGKFAQVEGTIVVEDDGHGMDESAIRRGWLTIANSPKREQKEARQVTGKGRTPIGDKGLGRLGSQRLAENVELVTRPESKSGTEYYVGFSWNDFRDTSRLGGVPVEWDEKITSSKRCGTKLVLSGLREPEIWQTEGSLNELQRKLSGMISPFEESKDFRVHLEVDGKRMELAEITKRVRETALVRYAFEFDGENIRIKGIAKLKYFQPNSKQDQALFASICRKDDGLALYRFLFDRRTRGRPLILTHGDKRGWFLEFGIERKLDEVDGARRIEGSVVNPGPFRGEVDAVSLDSTDFDSSNFEGTAIGRQSEYRNLVRDLAGIRVYRDGFGIRVGEDWLELGRQWTGGGSYYGLRPGNVLGFVAISAFDNPNLEETTSREGFLVTPAYENFFFLLTQFVKFAGDTQEFLRRGVLEFLKEHKERNEGIEPGEDHSSVSRRIDDVAARLSAQQVKVKNFSGHLRKAGAGAAKTLDRVRKELGPGTTESASVSRVLKDLEEQLARVSTAASTEERMLDEVSSVLDEASNLKSTREILDKRWEALNEQVSALYESVSLGLTAEVLSHEIHNVADRLAKKSAILLRQVEKGARKSSIKAYIEEVRSSVATMRKQLAHLTPSLRYLRERRDEFELSALIDDQIEFHQTRLEENNIKITAEVLSPGVRIRMNKGKLIQVFDNLILNAEYWLKEAIRARHVKNGEIKIVVDGNHVRVTDNGRGVDESVEDTLFEPFVTMKSKGEGRGLGLFVCQQLLDSESCQISLLPDRNDHGRRFTFELDFSGAVDG